MAGADVLLGVVGPYRLHARVPAATGLETYAGRKHPSGESVWVDRIDPRLTRAHADVARIVAAAREVASILHPNVVQLRELLQSTDAYYLVREQVPGRALAALLDRLERSGGPRLPLWLSLHVAAEILTGLTAVHARDVAHGALDAAQVLLTDRGEVKVDGALVAAALRPNHLHLCPEGVISQPADVFAVGVLLYRMLTGRRPFDGGNATATRAQMQYDERVPPSAYDPSLSRGVDALALSLLSPDPETRPRGALAALADVMACAGEQGWSRSSDDVAAALAPLLSSPVSVAAPRSRAEASRAHSAAPPRVVSYVGRALAFAAADDHDAIPVALDEDRAVPLIPREELQWSRDTGDFAHLFVPPRPSITPELEPEPLLLITLADGRVERAYGLEHVVHLWQQSENRPRLVARPGTAWRDADEFAALAGIESPALSSAPLKVVTHVGDLAQTSLLSLLGELARGRVTGTLMIMDPAEPRTSRRTVSVVGGAIAGVGSSHPAHQLPDWLMRGGWIDPGELGSLLREVIRSGRSLVDLVAQRRREEPARLWAKAWTEKLADPLCTRRGRYAFDASAVTLPVPDGAPTVAALLIDVARRAKTPEELRQWAASRRTTRYAVTAELEAWTRALALDERLTTLSRELARHPTIDATLQRTPGDAGAIFLLAYLFHETRALTFARPTTEALSP